MFPRVTGQEVTKTIGVSRIIMSTDKSEEGTRTKRTEMRQSSGEPRGEDREVTIKNNREMHVRMKPIVCARSPRHSGRV